ncbi:MAG: hypothetical protein IT410_00125 [Candidatus Doudnabacteria bacterium]|nr:hypothetical protein [Candidatus Doudnabacteria bacterium]
MNTAMAYEPSISINELGTGVPVRVIYGSIRFEKSLHVVFEAGHYLVSDLNGVGVIVHLIEPLLVNSVVILSMGVRQELLDLFAGIGHQVAGSDPISELVIQELFHHTVISAV